jgi:hypothetical protein
MLALSPGGSVLCVIAMARCGDSRANGGSTTSGGRGSTRLSEWRGDACVLAMVDVRQHGDWGPLDNFDCVSISVGEDAGVGS